MLVLDLFPIIVLRARHECTIKHCSLSSLRIICTLLTARRVGRGPLGNRTYMQVVSMLPASLRETGTWVPSQSRLYGAFSAIRSPDSSISVSDLATAQCAIEALRRSLACTCCSYALL